MKRVSIKDSLPRFIDKYNRHTRDFTSWSVIKEADYTERSRDPTINNGNAILCINTSTQDTMKYMLLAYYLIARNMKNVSFIYIWVGDAHEPTYRSAILKDMVSIFSSFMRREYGINSKNFLTYTQVNEMNFDHTMCEAMDLKEIYYSPLRSKRKALAVIPLNIARSVAKSGTMLTSPQGSEVAVRQRSVNTHTDNVIKGSLTNPQLIDKDAVYNKMVPEAKIQKSTITFTTTGQAFTGGGPMIIYINPDAEEPELNLTPEQLDSLVSEADINYRGLLAYVNELDRYYNELGIGQFVRRRASNKATSLVAYVKLHLLDELKREVYDALTDEYVIVFPDE